MGDIVVLYVVLCDLTYPLILVSGAGTSVIWSWLVFTLHWALLARICHFLVHRLRLSRQSKQQNLLQAQQLPSYGALKYYQCKKERLC